MAFTSYTIGSASWAQKSWDVCWNKRSNMSLSAVVSGFPARAAATNTLCHRLPLWTTNLSELLIHCWSSNFYERNDLYGRLYAWCSDVRLVGSSSPNEGRLEVYYSDVWGTVCEDLFDYIDAGVVCNSLGYGLVLVWYNHCFYCQKLTFDASMAMYKGINFILSY